MSIRNLNWYNLQTTRRYPLDDSVVGESDEVRDNLPNDILVDAHLRYPQTLGKYAYVQGVTISPGIVTLIIGVSESLNAEGAAVAAVTIVQPAEANVNYTVQPLVPGVAGWVAFGPGVETFFSGRYSLPIQTLISHRCARPYRPLPIPSLGKLGLATTLSDQITVVGESPVEVVRQRVQIDNKNVDAVVLRLNQNDASLNYNPYSHFLGACGQRPESGTCPKPPIETINGVGPDCDGNINFSFLNLSGQAFKDCGGIDIQTTLSLDRVCQQPIEPRVFYSDLCCPDEVEDIAARDALPVESLYAGKIVKTLLPEPLYWKVQSLSGGTPDWVETTEIDAICGWPDPTQAIQPDIVIDLPPLDEYPEITTQCIDFCSCAGPPPLFEVRNGVFSIQTTDAPYACAPCGAQTAPPNTFEEIISTSLRNTYAATDNNATNVAILKNAATDWALGKTIDVQLKIGGDGLARNGGVVINYYRNTAGATPQIRYLVAVLDVSRSQLRLLRYVNNSFTIETQEQFLVRTNQWYSLSVTPTFTGANVNLQITAAELSPTNSTVSINTSVTLENYGPLTGTFGLYANRSYTYFNKFGING
jgi:hypothetical protein